MAQRPSVIKNTESSFSGIVHQNIKNVNRKSLAGENSATADILDLKKHSFAKDGFMYRRAYYKDFDGTYYLLTLSVGQNGDINTVYNVGKMSAKKRR